MCLLNITLANNLLSLAALSLSCPSLFFFLKENGTQCTLLAFQGSSSPTETKPWYMSGFSGDGRSDLVQDVLSKVPQFHDTSSSLRIGSPPLSARSSFLDLRFRVCLGFSDLFCSWFRVYPIFVF